MRPIRTRQRNITQTPNSKGLPCPPVNEKELCSKENCPIDGYWHEWSSWSACSETCNLGTRTRNRVCSERKFGGMNCTGKGENKHTFYYFGVLNVYCFITKRVQG